jgi:transposase
MRAKRGRLAQALEGRFTDHHAQLLRLGLDQLDYLDAAIAQASGQIDVLLAQLPAAAVTGASSRMDTEAAQSQVSYRSAVQGLCEVPGIGPDIARTLIAEVGLDMNVFGTADRLAAWAKVAPLTKQSGRRKGRGTTGKGNPYLKSALGQAATAAAKTATFLGERYRRLIKGMPKSKAKTAIARSLLVIVFELLADPAARYRDLGADFYIRHLDTRRRTDRLVRQLEALGHSVTLAPAA